MPLPIHVEQYCKPTFLLYPLLLFVPEKNIKVITLNEILESE